MKRTKVIYFPNQEKLKKYEENGVYFTKPRLVAFYDYNNGKISKAQRINYYKNLTDKQYPLDLNVDLSSFIPRDSQMYSININMPLKYYMSAFGQIIEDIEKTKVITRLGALRSIMESYYNPMEDNLIVYASRYNGNLYLIQEKYEDSMEKLKPSHTHDTRLKQLLFSDKPYNMPNTNGPCDQNINLIGIYRSNFGKYDVIYNGEIHGILAEEEFKDFDDLDALNECRFVYTKQMWKWLKSKDVKYLNYWLQAYLLNVKEIHIGYKNKDGIVDEPIELNYVRDLPTNRFWKPAICTGFLYEFLQNIEECMSSVNCLNTVYEYRFNRKSKNITYKIYQGLNEKTFISEEYMEFCEKKKKI